MLVEGYCSACYFGTLSVSRAAFVESFVDLARSGEAFGVRDAIVSVG